MKKSAPAFARLCIITLIAAVLLAVTNAVTDEPIEQAARAAAFEARKRVLSSADSFTQLQLPQGSAADNVYLGMKGDEEAGYTATATVKGSQGPIAVTIGIDTEGAITGVSVGGSKFVETAGIGTKCQEPQFLNQFIGHSAPLTLGRGVDAVTGATITSNAVVKGVNAASKAALELEEAVPVNADGE